MALSTPITECRHSNSEHRQLGVGVAVVSPSPG